MMPPRAAPSPTRPVPLLLALAACALALAWRDVRAQGASAVPRLQHIIVVVMENQSYDRVRGAPYIASLIAASSSFSNFHAVAHPSQPNYLALWSGSQQGVTDNRCPPAGSPFGTPNLGQACEAAGLTWRSYNENLPSAGSARCAADGALYTRKHNPWTDFNNLDHGNERPFSDLAADIKAHRLPALAFVVPNNGHNMHDCPVSTGDRWLADHLPAMVAAVGSLGLVVLTWDEDDSKAGNHILTVFAGEPVRPGYVSTRAVTHYTLLRTLCDALELAPLGVAAREQPITDVWRP